MSYLCAVKLSVITFNCKRGVCASDIKPFGVQQRPKKEKSRHKAFT